MLLGDDSDVDVARREKSSKSVRQVRSERLEMGRNGDEMGCQLNHGTEEDGIFSEREEMSQLRIRRLLSDRDDYAASCARHCGW